MLPVEVWKPPQSYPKTRLGTRDALSLRVTQSQLPKRIAVIGGGPIGMEAALYGAVAGYDVQLFERGALASNVRDWGFVHVFTEWARNRSPLALRLLCEGGAELPPSDTYATGDELAAYIERLSQLAPLQGRIHSHTEVVALTRERCLKSDFDEDLRRTEYPFRLLLRERGELERLHHADVVIDATGVYHSPNPLGNGGAPCPGELPLSGQIDYALPDVLGSQKVRFADRHTLVVGSGHSAASTLLAVAELFEAHPQTHITWVVRRDVARDGNPYAINPNDSSPHRQELNRRANELSRHPHVTFCPRTVVDALSHDGTEFRVALQTPDGTRAVVCDNIAAHTGFRADLKLWSELQMAVHPSTGGPLGLSNVLMSENKRLGTGLSTGYAERSPNSQDGQDNQKEAQGEQKQVAQTEESRSQAAQEKAAQDVDPRVADPALLKLPEPDFYVIGIKSYGRDAGFLMQNGFRQVRDVYRWVSSDMNLNLYGDELK